MHAIEQRRAQQVLHVAAQQRARRGIDVDDDALRVEHQAFGVGVEELLQAFLRFAQRVLSFVLLRDVLRQRTPADVMLTVGVDRRQRDVDPLQRTIGKLDAARERCLFVLFAR